MSLSQKRFPFLLCDSLQVPISKSTGKQKTSLYLRIQNGKESFLINQLLPQDIHALAEGAYIDGLFILLSFRRIGYELRLLRHPMTQRTLPHAR